MFIGWTEKSLDLTDTAPCTSQKQFLVTQPGGNRQDTVEPEGETR